MCLTPYPLSPSSSPRSRFYLASFEALGRLLFLDFFYTCLLYSSPSPFSGPPPNNSFASPLAFCPPARDSHAFSSSCVGCCRNFCCSALSLISWNLVQRRSACNIIHLGENIRPSFAPSIAHYSTGWKRRSLQLLHPLSTPRFFFGPTHPRLPDVPGLYLVVNSTHCKTGGCALQLLDFWTTLFDERTTGEGGNRS